MTFTESLEKLQNEATEGPFVYGENGISFIETVKRAHGPDKDLPQRVCEFISKEDGELFVKLRNALPEIIAVLKAAESLCPHLNRALDDDDKRNNGYYRNVEGLYEALAALERNGEE